MHSHNSDAVIKVVGVTPLHIFLSINFLF